MRFPDLRKFFGAVVTAIKFFLTHGKIWASDEEKNRRMSICRVCPYSVEIPCKAYPMRQCLVCSCITEPKASLITESCPKGLWEI